MGTRTTVIAPVGLLIWTRLPKIEATAPVTIAVTSRRPAHPRADAEPQGQGECDHHHHPAVRSRVCLAWAQSARRGGSCLVRASAPHPACDAFVTSKGRGSALPRAHPATR